MECHDRKEYPMAEGMLDYFPDALVAVSHVSFVGNQQHNPGQPLHWAKEKSQDHADALMRHLVDRGKFDNDGLRHSAKVAWRALALLQTEIENENAGTFEALGPDDAQPEAEPEPMKLSGPGDLIPYGPGKIYPYSFTGSATLYQEQPGQTVLPDRVERPMETIEESEKKQPVGKLGWRFRYYASNPIKEETGESGIAVNFDAPTTDDSTK